MLLIGRRLDRIKSSPGFCVTLSDPAAGFYEIEVVAQQTEQRDRNRRG